MILLKDNEAVCKFIKYQTYVGINEAVSHKILTHI